MRRAQGLSYDELHARMLLQRQYGKRIRLYNLLKEREVDAYYSIGAYAVISSSRKTSVTDRDRAQSFFDNMGMLCKSLVEGAGERHACGNPSSNHVAERLSKYLVRMLPADDPIYPIADRINERRKAARASRASDVRAVGRALGIRTMNGPVGQVFERLFGYLVPHTARHLACR